MSNRDHNNHYLHERNLLLCHILKQHESKLKFPPIYADQIKKLLVLSSSSMSSNDDSPNRTFPELLSRIQVPLLLHQLSNNEPTIDLTSYLLPNHSNSATSRTSSSTSSSTSSNDNRVSKSLPCLPPVPTSGQQRSLPTVPLTVVGVAASQQDSSPNNNNSLTKESNGTTVTSQVTLPPVPVISPRKQENVCDVPLDESNNASASVTEVVDRQQITVSSSMTSVTSTQSSALYPTVHSAEPVEMDDRDDTSNDDELSSQMNKLMKFVMGHAVLAEDPTSKFHLSIPMSEHDMMLVSYESILLGSTAMTELSQEERTVGLSSVRKYCNINERDHLDMISNFTLDSAVSQSLRAANDIEQQMKVIGASKKLFVSERERMKLLIYRWLVVKSFRYSTRSNNAIEFFVRQIKLFANTIVMRLRILNQAYLVHNDVSIRKSEYEFILVGLFEKLIQTFENEPSKVTPIIREADDTVNSFLSQLSDENIDGVTFVNPFNLHLYNYLMQAKLGYMQKMLHKSDEDSEADVDTDEDLIEDDDPVNELLTYSRVVLGVSDIEDKLCFINQLIESAQHSSYVSSMHLEKQCIRELEYFSQFDDKDLENSTEALKTFVFARVFNLYGVMLCDIFDHYLEDTDLLKTHLKLYNTALRRCIKRASFDSLQKESMKAIVQLSTMRDFIRMRDARINIAAIPKIEIEGFEDMGDPTKAPSKDYSKLIEFAEELYNELSTAIDSHYSIVDIFYNNSGIEAILTTIGLYSNELIHVMQMSGGLSPETAVYFEKLQKLIDLLSSNTEDRMKVGSTTATRYDISRRLIEVVDPLSNAMVPILENFIRLAQERFTGYMERSLKLEKWTPMSDENLHSSSLVDLFTFLEQPTNDLFSVVLPNLSHFYRGYAQCVSGIVQRYCELIVRDIPSPQDLVPQIPKIPKSKKGLAKVLSNPNSTKKKTSAMQAAMAEERRYALGKKFGYEELFVRLNNLTFARKKFITLVDDVVHGWNSMRGVYLLKGHTERRPRKKKTPADDTESDTQSSSSEASESASDHDQDTSSHREEDTNEGKATPEDSTLSSFLPTIDLQSTIAGTGGYIVSLIQNLCEYIGTRNIYIELYPAIFKNLYIPSVDDNRLEHVLEKNFDPCMESLHESVTDAFCSELIMKTMFRKLVRAIFTVILDGGPERCRFKPTDAPLLLKDIGAIETLFYADGSGIKSLPYIRKYTLKLRTIISTVMDKSTTQILAGSEGNDCFDLLPEKKPLFPDSPWTKQIVFRVLYHRISVDPMAKKWFEKHKMRYDW